MNTRLKQIERTTNFVLFDKEVDTKNEYPEIDSSKIYSFVKESDAIEFIKDQFNINIDEFYGVHPIVLTKDFDEVINFCKINPSQDFTSSIMNPYKGN